MATTEERLAALEAKVTAIEEIEAPLTFTKHVWDSALKPTGSFLTRATKSLLPYALTSLLTLLAAGSLTIPGCPGPVPPAPAPIPPGPTPPPAPPVPVVQTKLLVNILHDATTDTPAWSQLAYSSTLRQQLAKAGHVVRVYEASTDEYKALNFAPFVARGGGLPAVVMQLPDGTVKGAIKMPATEADFLKAVQDAGGL